jgi:hypothetical protein
MRITVDFTSCVGCIEHKDCQEQRDAIICLEEANKLIEDTTNLNIEPIEVIYDSPA